VYGVIFEQLDVVLTIAAGLSIQSVFTQRSFREYECVQARQRLVSDIGDLFTLINVYREWVDRRRRNEDTRKWARNLGVEEARLYEIIKLRRQIRQIIDESELSTKARTKEWDQLSSRDRKIKIGEKRKLFDLKKKARTANVKRRVLKEGRHFDNLIMDDGKFNCT
jgi:HrpA-like RNA helicase